MTVRLLYFAWVRERIGIGEETVDLPDGLATLGELLVWLQQRGPNYAHAFADEEGIRTAVDQTHANLATPLAGASEIAFFPPVTGG